MNIPIKVNRVKSLDEIRVLEDLKVDFIGLHTDNDVVYNIDNNPFWNDDRYLLEEEIPLILSGINHAKTFVEIPSDSVTEKFCEELTGSGIDMIQFAGLNSWNSSAAKICERSNIKIVYSNIYCVPEDDPHFSNLTGKINHQSFFDIQVFPTERDAWETLYKPDPKIIKDIILLEDIEKLVLKLPVFISLNFTRENVREIVKTFESIPVKGLSFTLSPNKIGSYHSYGFHELVELIKSIRSL